MISIALVHASQTGLISETSRRRIGFARKDRLSLSCRVWPTPRDAFATRSQSRGRTSTALPYGHRLRPDGRRLSWQSPFSVICLSWGTSRSPAPHRHHNLGSFEKVDPRYPNPTEVDARKYASKVQDNAGAQQNFASVMSFKILGIFPMWDSNSLHQIVSGSSCRYSPQV